MKTATTNRIDETLSAFIWLDLLLAEAEDRLPLPPRVPADQRVTVRPARVS